MNAKEVSILIVHYNTPGLLRQTLKGIFSSCPQCTYEVIVVDNNPGMRIKDKVQQEFPNVKVIASDSNLGFGGGMNLAMERACGKYFFVFNPDIALFPGAIEELYRFMEKNLDVGIVGPQLLHPDRSIQNSCYRFANPMTIVYRRVPLLRSIEHAKKSVADYLMAEWDHGQTRDVDHLLGAAMFIRSQAIKQVGGFDPRFFIYFEDQDLCRRFWENNWRVVYHPDASIIHYHRRETAEGGFIKQLTNPLTKMQIKSAIEYYKKYKGKGNPREQYFSKVSVSNDCSTQIKDSNFQKVI
ncbi:MAG: glycosyltransferase family 2 protein [Patescibacteria group bacterium]